MKWESQDESENTRIINKIGKQEDSENTRLNHQKCRKVRNPWNSGRAIIMEGESAQGDAGFESEMRGFADAGVSVARITDTGITDAGIADAGLASQECQTRE